MALATLHFAPAMTNRTASLPRGRTVARVSVATVPGLAGAKYAAELQYGIDAVRLASKLCRTVQRQLSDHEKVEKLDDSPVTVADYAAQAVVTWALLRGSGAKSISMVAEEDSVALRDPAGKPMLLRITELVNSIITSDAESKGTPLTAPLSPEDIIALIDQGGSQGGPSGRHWVLDPIDGTRGFVGMRQYSVCLGMLQDGEVALGVLGCPNLPQGHVAEDAGGASAMHRSADEGVGSLFVAHRGHGAWMAPLWEEGEASILERVQVEDLKDFTTARYMESVESRHSSHSFTAAVAEAAGVAGHPPLRMDSQVKYGLLSRGAASVFMRFPPPTYKEKIWDHAAGFVIVEEAGGKVTDAGGRRLDFSRGRYLELEGGIIAAPPALHEQLISAVGRVQLAAVAGH